MNVDPDPELGFLQCKKIFNVIFSSIFMVFTNIKNVKIVMQNVCVLYFKSKKVVFVRF